MNILIVTDAYPPELRSSAQLMRELAVSLKKQGHNVVAVTSQPKDAVLKETPQGISKEDGVHVIRVNTIPHHNVPFFVKGLSWLLMPRIFWGAVKKHCSHIDAVIVHSPPLPLSYVAKRAKKEYGAKYILNVQDIFPQNAIDLGILKNGFIAKFFERMEKKAYRECDQIVTPSNEHKNYLVGSRSVPKEKIDVIYHWVDTKPFEEAENTGKFRKQWGLEKRFIIFFGGVMGPSQGLDILLRIGKKIGKRHPEIAFLVCGDGSEKQRLLEQKDREGVRNVFFKDWVSKEDYRNLLKEVDLGLICLTAKNTTPAVPAKLTGYLASGLPALGLLHAKSEAHQIIDEAHCGASAIYEDEETCLETISWFYKNREHLPAYGANALHYAKEHLAADKLVQVWEEVLEKQPAMLRSGVAAEEVSQKSEDNPKQKPVRKIQKELLPEKKKENPSKIAPPNKRVALVFGTRPEAIKLAPVVRALKKEGATPVVCIFQQHKKMLSQTLEALSLKPDHIFGIELSDRALLGKANIFKKGIAAARSGIGLLRFITFLKKQKPDLVMVQGDTSTAYLAAWIAYHFKIKVAHVEAGLRTGDKYAPFPEEMNRKLLADIADIHFAPTESARKNLLNEGVESKNIHVVGNTAIDALLKVSEGITGIKANKKVILVTAHRRESFGRGLGEICDAIKEIAKKHKDVGIIYPVHANPNVRGTVYEKLEGIENITLMDPVPYNEMVALMKSSYLILTDSGGLQEEAPSLDKPVLVMREETERQEGVEVGTSILVGTKKEKIITETERLLKDKDAYNRMAQKPNPYGDGTASEQIAGIVKSLE